MKQSITDISIQTGLSPSVIRYYEQEGLLPHLQRKSSGVRYFTEEDLERLYFILALKEAGLSLKEIQECFQFCDRGDETIDKRIQLFLAHKQNIRKKIAELEACITHIDEKIQYLEKKEMCNKIILKIT